MSYSWLFSGQQYEDVKTRCKNPAGRSNTWIGDPPNQNMEETQSPQNVHFFYVSSQHTCPVTLRLWRNWFESEQEQLVQLNSVIRSQATCCNVSFFSPLASLTFSFLFSIFKLEVSELCRCTLSSITSLTSRTLSSRVACSSSKAARRLPYRKKISLKWQERKRVLTLKH